MAKFATPFAFPFGGEASTGDLKVSPTVVKSGDTFRATTFISGLVDSDMNEQFLSASPSVNWNISATANASTFLSGHTIIKLDTTAINGSYVMESIDPYANADLSLEFDISRGSVDLATGDVTYCKLSLLDQVEINRSISVARMRLSTGEHIVRYLAISSTSSTVASYDIPYTDSLCTMRLVSNGSMVAFVINDLQNVVTFPFMLDTCKVEIRVAATGLKSRIETKLVSFLSNTGLSINGVPVLDATAISNMTMSATAPDSIGTFDISLFSRSGIVDYKDLGITIYSKYADNMSDASGLSGAIYDLSVR